MTKFSDVSGKRFGRLVAKTRLTVSGQKTRWLCQCDCGNTCTPLLETLNRGCTRSCGCLALETRRKNRLKHGYTRKGKRPPEYAIWRGMKQRCGDVNTSCYPRYGGRGIKVCEQWLNSFENFLADMGRKPSKDHSLDRIDNNGHYCPENCRWATRKQQARNKSNNTIIEIDGVSKCLAEWLEEKGLDHQLIMDRRRRGWSYVDSLTVPKLPRGKVFRQVKKKGPKPKKKETT